MGQFLFHAARLYERLPLAGEPAHAAYLAAFCSAPAGRLLTNILEQGLFGSCGARL